MRYLPRLAPALVPLMLLSQPVFADEAADRLALAQEITKVSVESVDLEALIATMWKPLADQVEASGKVLSPEQKAQIHALYIDTFRAPMTELMLGQDVVMADLMSLEELSALRDFYTTEAGRSVMSKLPQVMERQQPQIVALVQSTMPLVVPKVMEIINPPAPGQN